MTVLEGSSVDTTITLVAGVTAHGLVVDDAGKPIRGAWVMHATTTAATDAQGRFELAGLSAPVGTVDVMEGDHVQVRGAALTVPGDNRFVLSRCGILQGRVVHARTGEGLDDFTVALVGGDGQQGSIGVEWVRGGRRFRHTSGSWTARGLMLTPGSTWRVRISAPGCAAVVRTVVAVVDSPSDECVLTSGVRVHGHLVEAATGSVAGAALRLFDHAPEERVWERYEPQTRSAGDGTFAFEQVAAGEVWIEIATAGTVTSTVGPFLVGATDLDLGALIVGAGARISGRLRDDQGQLLANVDLHASSVHADSRSPTSLQTRTEADGVFTFAGLQPGLWRLFASFETADGTLVIDQRLQVEATCEVDVQPAGRGVVRGEVRGTWPETSPPSVMVRSADASAGATVRGFFASTPAKGKEGRFCLRGLPPGCYEISAMVHEGWSPRFVRAAGPVTVTDGATVLVEIDLGGH